VASCWKDESLTVVLLSVLFFTKDSYKSDPREIHSKHKPHVAKQGIFALPRNV